MDDEDILGLTPIQGLPDGDLYASDSDAPSTALKAPHRFNPHTPLDPRPRSRGGAARPVGDLPTPLDPHGESFASRSAATPDGGLPLERNSSLFASVHNSSAFNSGSSDDARGNNSRLAFTTPARSASADDVGTVPRARSGSSARHRHAADEPRATRGAERASRSRRSARAAQAADLDLDLEPMLRSLRALTRELRDVFVDTFINDASAPRPLATAPHGYAGGSAGRPYASWPQPAPRGPYSLATRQQLAAVRVPLHRSSFALGTEQFVLTVNRLPPPR